MVFAFSVGFGAFKFVFALTVQNGLHEDDRHGGLALGVATGGTFYLALEPHGVAHAFASAEYVQMGIVALLAVGAAALPRFATAAPAIES